MIKKTLSKHNDTLFSILIFMLICTICAFTSHADSGTTLIYYVTQNGGTSTAAAPDGRSWATAFPAADLQTAITNASAGGTPGGEVWVAKGTYIPTIKENYSYNIPGGVSVYGGFTGNETSSADRNPIANETILQGASQNVSIVKINTAAYATLDGFTITSGDNGGVSVKDSTAEIRNCIFKNNSAPDGGCIKTDMSDAPTVLSVDKCAFAVNTATGNGGAIYNSGNCTLSVTNSTFAISIAFQGGGIYNNEGNLSVMNCTFTKNCAHNSSNGGSGIFHKDSDGVFIANITNSIFYGNDFTDISNWSSNNVDSQATVKHCVVERSYAGGTGTTHIITTPPNLIPLDKNLNVAFDARDYYIFGTGPGSSARDTATSDGAPNVDQRGVGRPWGLGYDIGSYEYAPANVITLSPPSLSMVVGKTAQITAITSPDSSLAASAHWDIQYPDVISIDRTTGSTVTITALKEGATEIKVSAPGILEEAICTITVSKGQTVSVDKEIEKKLEEDIGDVAIKFGIEDLGAVSASKYETIKNITKDTTLTVQSVRIAEAPT